jgi:uncharacterized protein (TIGR01244 family)
LLKILTNIRFAILMLLPIVAGAAETPRKLDWPDFRSGIFQSGDLYIAGQPLTETAMQRLKSEGVTTIVNLRTPKEMASKKSTPIAEADLVEALSITYHHLPSGGEDYPYSSETVNTFADILNKTPGKVLLHCNSGRRAVHLWVAHLVANEGIDIDEAVRLGRAANFGTVPLEGYLSKPLTYRQVTSK